jgi:vanillate O-demethylase ferredoxin subunit
MNDKPFSVEITHKRHESSEVVVFELATTGPALPAYEPGAHIDVETPSGWRQYSLWVPHQPGGRYRIAVKREDAGRGGSRWLHEHMAVGDRLRIRAPRNQFRLAAQAEHHCLLAGGIGITPLLAMAQALWIAGAAFELAYFSRGREQAAFWSELRRVPWADRAALHFDDDASHRIDLRSLCARQPAGTHFYSCGPGGFMAAVREAVLDRPAQLLHEEKFVADAAPASGLDSYEVQLVSSGQLVRVTAPQTLLQALRSAGADPLTSCEAGVCGSCITRVLDGEPVHGDSCMGEAERRTHMALCCGGSRSARLVLDL